MLEFIFGFITGVIVIIYLLTRLAKKKLEHLISFFSK